MAHSAAAILWAGFVATILSAAFFWIARAYGWTRFDAPVQVGCLVSPDPRHPRTETLGFLLILVVGSAPVAFAYAAALTALGRSGIGAGALLGLVHGFLALVALPLLGTISACARTRGKVEPGVMGIGWGRFTPLVFLAGHAIYGTVLALALGAF